MNLANQLCPRLSRRGNTTTRKVHRVAGGFFQPMKINPQFRDLIPPLSADELAGLEAALRKDGCRDALVTWNDTLIDGHNRYEICTHHNLPFKTEAMEFESELHVMLWIRMNQLGRRNLTDDQRAMIADAVAEIESRLRLSEAGKKGGRGNKKPLDAVAKGFKEGTRAKTAKAAKVSERKMKKARAIRKKSPAMAAKVEAGEHLNFLMCYFLSTSNERRECFERRHEYQDSGNFVP